MSNDFYVELLVIQIVIVVALLTIIFLLVKTRYSISLDKKFSKYTINSLNYKPLSFFDKIADSKYFLASSGELKSDLI